MVYNNLLLNGLEEGHFKQTISMFQHMVAKGLPVCDFSVSLVVRSFLNLRRTGEAFSMLGFCFKRGINPNDHIYGGLILGHLIDNKVESCRSLFKKLIYEGICKPNVVLCSSVVNVYCTIEDYKSLDHVLGMVKDGEADVDLLNNFLASLYNQRFFDAGFKLYKHLTKNRFVNPNRKTFTIVIGGLSKTARIGNVKFYLNQMQKFNMGYDLEFINLMLKGYCHRNSPIGGEHFLKIMEDMGRNPGLSSYSMVLRCHCRNGDLGKASRLFSELRDKGFKPTTKTLNIVVQGFCSHGTKNDALMFFRRQLDNSFMPDATSYQYLIERFLKDEDNVGAHTLMAESLKKGAVVLDLLKEVGPCDIANESSESKQKSVAKEEEPKKPVAAANKNAGTVAAKKDNISDKSEYADGSDEEEAKNGSLAASPAQDNIESSDEEVTGMADSQTR